MIKTSHRRRYIEFRPPYQRKSRRSGNWALCLRFAREYLAPHRRLILLCTLLTALDSCGSFYLIAYYSRVVVDSILVVQPMETAPVERVEYLEKPPGVGGRERLDPRPAVKHPAGLRRQMETGATASGRPPRAGMKLAGLFVLYLITILAGNLINRLSTGRRIMLGRGVTKRLRDDMHAHVIRLSLAAQSVHTPGRLMARILSDVNTVQEHMLMLIINASSNLLMVLAGLLLLWWVDWRMALMVLCIMPVYVIIYRTARPSLEQANREQRHTNACLYGLSSQKFDAVRLIQSSGREKHESLVFHRLIACYFRDGMYGSRVGAITSMLGQTISALGTNGAIFLFGVHRVLAGDITLGQMLYAYGTAASLFAPVLALSRMNMTFAHLMVSLQRLAEIMDEPSLIAEAPDAREIAWPLRQSLAVRNVSFSYAPDMPLVLRDVSLEVPSGTWTCIMGASGSGKSTLLFLLGRLQDPLSGEILLDGVSLKKIKLAALRRHVALVPQEPQILSGTVRDNICYGRPLAEPGDIMEAARAAEFHDFVMTMPVKYETLLGEKGTSLSGGQRQRLSLARTLLTRPEILLLDDCTSALDAETEYRIQETLARVLRGKTAVMVSQRISMAQRCRQVCVLQDGVITESGTPDELLERGGYYARLHAQQTGQ